MALTGLFLCSFLVVHLIGNLQLLKNDGGIAFNEYAKFMTTFPLIKAMSYVLYASILFHAIDGFILVFQNRKARGQGYAHNKQRANTGIAARMMGVLGSLILIFIITHMAMYWGAMKFGELPMCGGCEGEDVKDLYALVVGSYTDGVWKIPGIAWVIIYVLAQVVLGFHLWHGFSSAFQSLGVNHKKYSPILKSMGKAFSVLIALGFAIIPIWIYVCSQCSHYH